MFKPQQLMNALVRWRDEYSDNIIPKPRRSIKGFYDYLARKSTTYKNDFKDHKSLFLKLGDPHYAGGKDGVDGCQRLRFVRASGPSKVVFPRGGLRPRKG